MAVCDPASIILLLSCRVFWMFCAIAAHSVSKWSLYFWFISCICMFSIRLSFSVVGLKYSQWCTLCLGRFTLGTNPSLQLKSSWSKKLEFGSSQINDLKPIQIDFCLSFKYCQSYLSNLYSNIVLWLWAAIFPSFQLCPLLPRTVAIWNKHMAGAMKQIGRRKRKSFLFTRTKMPSIIIEPQQKACCWNLIWEL